MPCEGSRPGHALVVTSSAAVDHQQRNALAGLLHLDRPAACVDNSAALRRAFDGELQVAPEAHSNQGRGNERHNSQNGGQPTGPTRKARSRRACRPRINRHIAHRPAQRARHGRPATEANDEIGSSPAQAEVAGELLANCADFDRLIDERRAQTEYRCLQGNPLMAAPHLDPMRRFVPIRSDDSDRTRAGNAASVLAILGL